MASDDLIALFMISMKEDGNTEASRATYKAILSNADKALPYGLDCANEDELKAWLWRDGLSDNSRATYYGGISAFFEWGVKAGVLDFNPAARIKRPKAPLGFPRVAASAHVAYMVNEAPEPYRLWSKLAAYGGLRCIEVSRLHTEHVGQETTALHRGKGDKPRIVATHPIVLEAVRELPPGAITDYTPKEISDRYTRYCIRKGMRLSMHRLRGWYATHGYRATKDIRAVQRSLGHANPATTARYIDVSDEQLGAVASGLPVFRSAEPAAVPE